MSNIGLINVDVNVPIENYEFYSLSNVKETLIIVRHKVSKNGDNRACVRHYEPRVKSTSNTQS